MEPLENLRILKVGDRKPIKIDFPHNELIGKCVKKEFLIKFNQKTINEHMFVKVNLVTDDGLIIGILDNDSYFDKELVVGIPITMKISEIEEIMEINHDRKKEC